MKTWGRGGIYPFLLCTRWRWVARVTAQLLHPPNPPHTGGTEPPVHTEQNLWGIQPSSLYSRVPGLRLIIIRHHQHRYLRVSTSGCSCMVYWTTLSVSQTTKPREVEGLPNNECGRMCKKAAVTYLAVNQEMAWTVEKPVTPCGDLNPGPPHIRKKCLPFDHDVRWSLASTQARQILSAKVVKNDWMYTFTSSICFCGADRDNFAYVHCSSLFFQGRKVWLFQRRLWLYICWMFIVRCLLMFVIHYIEPRVFPNTQLHFLRVCTTSKGAGGELLWAESKNFTVG
jgi:hypothetical protein